MKYRLQELFLAVLFALVGVFFVVLGLGFLKISLELQNQPLMVTSGLIFFCVGTLLYFRTISVRSQKTFPFAPGYSTS
jgi:hypothetical protein